MLSRLSLTLKEQKDVKREVRGAAVPYHEPTSTDDDDDDVDVDDDTTSIAASASPRTDVRSWPSTPSTPASPAPSTVGELIDIIFSLYCHLFYCHLLDK